MRLCLALLSLLAAVAPASATDIQLKSGQVYHDVTILNRDATNLQVQVPYGVIVLPLPEVESIDGVPLSKPPPPPVAVPPPVSEAATLAPPYAHDWRMDYLLLAGLLASWAWVGMLLWVQRDVRGSAGEMRQANAMVLLLPGLGFLLYLVRRWQRRRQTNAGWSPFARTPRATVDPHPPAGLEIQFLDANRNPIEIKRDLPELSGIELASEVLEQALVQRASDVHVEPGDAGYRVRFRIDGILQERQRFERSDAMRMTAALKTLAQIDVAEKRKAQDGRFRVGTKDGEVDVRVATASSIHGEKLVLRILDQHRGVLGLSDLGMPPPMMAEFDRVIHSRSGMILATGPTGSGKTSTLYAALSRLDAQRLNIMSIEDPVEYELTGATQIPVNPRAGVTYESGLRSILRQDPDVIFVGEMRDTEAAKIAVRAALTGHLVFTSLHSRDALGALVRLEEMGIEPYQIPAALLLVVSQRLVRVLCQRCRQPATATGTELNELGLKLPAEQAIYRAQGCDHCEGTGYQGRTGIFELLVMSEPLRKALHDKAGPQQLMELALRQGYRSYHEDGLAKIVRGITTVDEVLQAG